MTKRKIAVLFALLAVFAELLTGSDELFRYDFSQDCSLTRKGNAKVVEGTLRLDGNGSFAVVPNSGTMHFPRKGMTVAATVRLHYPVNASSPDDRMDMFFSKGKEFIFGRSGAQLYCNFHDGKTWCAPLRTREGSVPEPDEWAHVAAVFEYEEDKAQGDFGYRVSIYLNGEKEISRKFYFVEPAQTDDPIELGRGFGGGPWFMNGEFANAVMFDRPLNAAQIARLCSQEPRVKAVRKGFHAVEPELKERLDSIKVRGAAAAQWLTDSFLRAASAGYDQKKLLALSDRLTEQGLSGDPETLAALFDRETGELHILLTPELAAAVLTGQGSGPHPVIGVLDRRTGKGIFGEKSIYWEIPWTCGSEKGVLSSGGKGVTWESQLAGDTVRIVWNGGEEFPFTAVSEVRFAGPRMESTFEIQNHSDRTFESVLYPACSFRHLGEGDTLVYPSMSGILVPNPTEEPIVKPGPYPSGSAVMQFGAYYNAARQGIYFGYEDGLAGSKIFHTDGKRSNLFIGWENPVVAEPGKNHFKLNGKAVIELYQGQWFEAGQIYRAFLEKEAAWWIPELPRQSSPEWFRSNTLWILFNTRDGKDAEDIREVFTYLRGYFELPFAGHWYLWSDDEKLGWPHYPIKDFTLRIREELRKAGIRTVPYIDSRLWKVKDGPNNTDHEYLSRGSRCAARDAQGNIYVERYGGAEYAVMCPAAKEWQQVIAGLAKRISGYGFDGMYHDQVGTAAPQKCYDREHGHLPNDRSVWLEKGYWPMFASFLDDLRTHHPDFCHTTEENAEPYLKQMDGFLVWRWWEDRQIPLFQSIYSGRVQFVGRTFSSMRKGDVQSFFSKIGQQLVNAEQMGWFSALEMAEADDRRLFTKKAMHLRLALLDWFNGGRMLAPIEFGSTMKTERPLWGSRTPHPVVMPVIANSAWMDRDGTRLWLFVNTQQNEESSAKPDVETTKGFWICREGASEPVFSRTAPAVSLKPLHSEVWVEGDREKADRIQRTLRKMASFDKGKPLRQVLDFSQKKITGTPDRMYDERDCSNYIFCNPTSRGNHFGRIQDGAMISFGIVDFGVEGAETVTVNAAVDPAFEGGTIQLFTAAPGEGEVESAVFPLKSTGGFGIYNDIPVKLKAPLTGKHRILFKINGQSACNFGGWKYSR